MGNKKRTYFMLLLGTGVDIEVGPSKDPLRPVRVFVPGQFSVRLTGEQARDLAEKLVSVYNALEFHYNTIPISPFEP